MKKILFSCVGTTDPVRGEHDGPMLHIARHYRPDKIYLFFSQEIYAQAQKDGRYEKTFEFIRTEWNGYSPEVEFVLSDIKDAHDIDVLNGPMYEAVERIRLENPDAEILINLTSGSPQMQMIMSQLALDARYYSRGIQVSNYQKASGTSERTNSRDYDIDLELAFNEDNEPSAENRCVEPRMYAVRREHMRRQVLTLLEQRNFEAVAQLNEALPEELLRLVRHLAERNRLHSAEAQRLANDLKGLPFRLYAYKSGDRTEYGRTCEYYLLMKNLVRAGHYSEFLLHMEPLTLQLQLALLNKLLAPRRIRTADFIISSYKGNHVFEPEALKNVYPELYEHYVSCLASRGWSPERKDISTYVCNDLLDFFYPLPQKPAALFDHYERLKELRNRLAHELCVVTDEEIGAECGADCASILNEIESTVIECYSACDPSVFSVYDRCIEYIREKL